MVGTGVEWWRVGIPPLTVGPLTEDDDGVLLWVHTGSATVETPDSRYRLESGTAIWMPAGIEHRTRTEAGAVVFPLRLPAAERPPLAGEPRVIVIPPGWADWLIHLWDDNSATRDEVPRADALVDLVATAPAPAPAPGARGEAPGHRHSLPMPRSREAAGVARTLLRNPASVRSLERFAARERISAKTLQRQFLRETGLSFSDWRTRARVAVAVRRLAEGRGIGETGRGVGFATPAGFTKAFRRHVGCPPSEYLQRLAPAGPRPDPATPPVAGMPELPAERSRTPPAIPARTFWQKVNDHHELMWVHRGAATLRIGSRAWRLVRGEAICVPAGLTHTVEMSAESLMLTVGVAHGRVRLALDDLIVFAFPPEADAVLLHTMVSEFTLFRPEADAGALTRMVLREQFLADRAGADRIAGTLGDVAIALRRDPADRRTLADWAAQLRTTPDELGREIVSQAGESFPRWRARIRMDVARDLLRAGDAPGQVYRRLGYTTPSAFSRAFTAAHGIAPREYQRREHGTP